MVVLITEKYPCPKLAVIASTATDTGGTAYGTASSSPKATRVEELEANVRAGNLDYSNELKSPTTHV